LWNRSSFDGPIEFASGDHIHSPAQVDEETEKSQIRIGLGRVTDEMRNPFKGLIEYSEMS
jgi:hypothetical protein